MSAATPANSLQQNATTLPPTLEHYLQAGMKEFAAHAVKFAMIEKSANLEAGSLVEALLSGLPDDSPRELAEWIRHGWSCAQSKVEMEAALAPMLNRGRNS